MVIGAELVMRAVGTAGRGWHAPVGDHPPQERPRLHLAAEKEIKPARETVRVRRLAGWWDYAARRHRLGAQ